MNTEGWRTGRLAALVLVAIAASGCLRHETTHTLYLNADGGARWVVEESAVYSDEEDPGERIREEQAFIGPALIGAHRMAQALQAVGPDGLVRTTVVRDERPFHVITEAPFTRVDRLFGRLFKECGLKAAVTLARDGSRSALRMEFDFRDGVAERESAAAPLLEDLDRLKFVLAEGRLIAGGGFDVPERSPSASISREWLAAADKAMQSQSQIALVLTWESGGQ